MCKQQMPISQITNNLCNNCKNIQKKIQRKQFLEEEKESERDQRLKLSREINILKLDVDTDEQEIDKK